MGCTPFFTMPKILGCPQLFLDQENIRYAELLEKNEDISLLSLQLSRLSLSNMLPGHGGNCNSEYLMLSFKLDLYGRVLFP